MRHYNMIRFGDSLSTYACFVMVDEKESDCEESVGNVCQHDNGRADRLEAGRTCQTSSDGT